MAYITADPTRTTPIGRHTAALFASAKEAFSNWRIYRNTLSELQELTDRELADLGITPSMIQSIATEAAYGKNA